MRLGQIFDMNSLVELTPKSEVSFNAEFRGCVYQVVLQVDRIKKLKQA